MCVIQRIPLVLAMGPTATVVGEALNLRQPIDTVSVRPTGSASVVYSCINRKSGPLVIIQKKAVLQ